MYFMDEKVRGKPCDGSHYDDLRLISDRTKSPGIMTTANSRPGPGSSKALKCLSRAKTDVIRQYDFLKAARAF
jgi:hypothetical protein